MTVMPHAYLAVQAMVVACIVLCLGLSLDRHCGHAKPGSES
jgi:hypothetical protein